MPDKTQPTQAMPDVDTPRFPRPTQPMDGKPKHAPLIDDAGFDTFMGHGGQSDIGDETEEGSANPNAAAQPD